MNYLFKKIPLFEVYELNNLYGFDFNSISTIGNSNIEFKAAWKGNRYAKVFNPCHNNKTYLKEERIKGRGKYNWWIFPFKTSKNEKTKFNKGDILQLSQKKKNEKETLNIYFVFKQTSPDNSKNKIKFFLNGFVTEDYKTALYLSYNIDKSTL